MDTVKESQWCHRHCCVGLRGVIDIAESLRTLKIYYWHSLVNSHDFEILPFLLQEPPQANSKYG